MSFTSDKFTKRVKSERAGGFQRKLHYPDDGDSSQARAGSDEEEIREGGEELQ